MHHDRVKCVCEPPWLYASNASFAQPTFLLCYGARLHHSQLNVVNTQYLCNS